MKFKWRLERILDITKLQERQKKAELLEVVEQIVNERVNLANYKLKLRMMVDNLLCISPQKRVLQQEVFMKHSSSIDNAIKRTNAKIAELEKLREIKSDQLRGIKQYREGLEKLRRQARMQFIVEHDRIEQKETDEVNNRRTAGAILAAAR